MHEAAGQAFPLGQPAGLGDQDRVEVDADQLDIGPRAEQAAIARTTNPSPHPTSTTRTGPAPPRRIVSMTRGQQGGDTPAELKFLTQPLQLAMHAKPSAST